MKKTPKTGNKLADKLAKKMNFRPLSKQKIMFSVRIIKFKYLIPEKRSALDSVFVLPDDVLSIIDSYMGYDENTIDQKEFFEQLMRYDKCFYFPKRDNSFNFKSRVTRMVVLSGDIDIVRRFFRLHRREFWGDINPCGNAFFFENELIMYVREACKYGIGDMKYFREVAKTLRDNSIIPPYTEIDHRIAKALKYR